jgi:hypothetical protein
MFDNSGEDGVIPAVVAALDSVILFHFAKVTYEL